MVTEVSSLPCAPTGNSLSSANEHRLQKKPLPKDAVLVDHRPDVVILGPQKQVELRLQEDAVLDGFRRGVSVGCLCLGWLAMPLPPSRMGRACDAPSPLEDDVVFFRIVGSI